MGFSSWWLRSKQRFCVPNVGCVYTGLACLFTATLLQIVVFQGWFNMYELSWEQQDPESWVVGEYYKHEVTATAVDQEITINDEDGSTRSTISNDEEDARCHDAYIISYRPFYMLLPFVWFLSLFFIVCAKLWWWKPIRRAFGECRWRPFFMGSTLIYAQIGYTIFVYLTYWADCGTDMESDGDAADTVYKRNWNYTSALGWHFLFYAIVLLVVGMAIVTIFYAPIGSKVSMMAQEEAEDESEEGEAEYNDDERSKTSVMSASTMSASTCGQSKDDSVGEMEIEPGTGK